MSTQLVLYPQTYKGQYSSTFTASTEFIVDGINFTSINSSTYYDHNASAGATSQLTLTNEALTYQHAQSGGIVANTWYRLRLVPTSNPAPTLPAQVANNLIIYGVSPSCISGVYQRLSNLTVGASYTINITMTSVSPTLNKQIDILHYNGVTRQFISSSSTISPTTSATSTFTPQTANDIIVILLTATVSTSVTINVISVKQMVVNPSGVYTELQDGQVICDLYEEEDIPLTLSIDDFKNVAEQVKSYSKDFNLPATKRNNQIFDNMFEVTRADDGLIFNPYVKTKCVLKQDGFILFEGYLRMIDIKDKEGEISYNVNLYSEVIALADILKDKTFTTLDFEELEHDYTRTQVEYSWNESPDTGITYLNPNTSGFRDANDTVKYPFIDWNHQIYPSASGNPVLNSLETAFRPCIQVKYLIDKIFAEANFNYTSDFFNTTDFKKLYMDFNWGSDNTPNDFTLCGIAYNETSDTDTIPTVWTTINTDQTNIALYPAPEIGYSDTTGFTCLQDNTTYNVSWTAIYVGITGCEIGRRILYTEALTGNTTVYHASPTYTWTGNSHLTDYKSIQILMMENDTLQYQAIGVTQVTSASGDVFPALAQYYLPACPNGNSVEMSVCISADILTNSIMLDTLRGELGQWDFLKGIMTMFNLVTMVDETNKDNILIETYSDIFINNTNSGNTSNLTLAARSIQHDWTDKVDVSQMELQPLTDLNKETIFKFVEDDDDYAFNVFKNANYGWLYGSEKINQEAFTMLQGIKEIIAEPFAATVVKPLMSQYSDFVVPAIYSSAGNNQWEGFDNSPRIFYNNGVKDLVSCTYYIPKQNGVVSANQDEFLQFSHLSDIPTVWNSGATPPVNSTDFFFSSRQLANAVGNAPVDNLYSMYWQPYFEELYHADTRIMTLKVNLSPADIAGFKFTDTVLIKNRSFRINKIEYKPNSLAKVEFILVP
tara:strand:- start:241 stop:3075 length:2835 start_codon:yes stop_codon:yes gene_type:complete